MCLSNVMDLMIKTYNPMKKYLYYFVALAGLVSCTVSMSPHQEPVVLNVGIKAAGGQTKATMNGSAEENLISSIQVFVFKQNQGVNMLEAAVRAESSSVDVTVTAGTKNVLVLVNEPKNYTAETDRSALLSMFSNLADNTPSSMVMIGQVTCQVSTADRILEVPVSRLASRVRLCKVTNSLRNGYAAKNVKLARVFLTGAAASAPYSSEGASSGFYATAGIGSALDLNGQAISSASIKAAVNSLIYKSLSSEVIADGASYSTPIPMYGYPNDGTTTKTHLVVELEIDGSFFTYPLDLPPMERNCTCEINELVITAIGNPSNGDDILDPGEDVPITFVQATFNVSVEPWTVVPISNGADGKYTI